MLGHSRSAPCWPCNTRPPRPRPLLRPSAIARRGRRTHPAALPLHCIRVRRARLLCRDCRVRAAEPVGGPGATPVHAADDLRAGRQAKRCRQAGAQAWHPTHQLSCTPKAAGQRCAACRRCRPCPPAGHRSLASRPPTAPAACCCSAPSHPAPPRPPSRLGGWAQRAARCGWQPGQPGRLQRRLEAASGSRHAARPAPAGGSRPVAQGVMGCAVLDAGRAPARQGCHQPAGLTVLARPAARVVRGRVLRQQPEGWPQAQPRGHRQAGLDVHARVLVDRRHAAGRRGWE